MKHFDREIVSTFQSIWEIIWTKIHSNTSFFSMWQFYFTNIKNLKINL